MTRFILIVAILVLALCNLVPRTSAQVNVTQKNNNPSRDGLYIDPAFTPGNAANLARDLNFNGTIVGNVHAQPLYIEGGPDGPMIIVVTASNNIYALNATDRHSDLAAQRYRTASHVRPSRAGTSIRLALSAHLLSILLRDGFSLMQ